MTRTNRFRGGATREQQAESIKEGIYLTFASLTLMLALAAHGEFTAWEALTTLALSTLGMAAAIFAADIVAHLVVHDTVMTQEERRHAARAAFGSLLTVVSVPLLLLLTAGLGWWHVKIAIWVVVATLVVTLIVITALAIRGTPLAWKQRLALVGALTLLSLAVVGVQTLAHR